MRPANCPTHAWIHAEIAVAYGLGRGRLWSWPRSERSRVLLAALDAMPSGVSATESEIAVDSLQEVWDAALGAALEIVTDRRRRKRRRDRR